MLNVGWVYGVSMVTAIESYPRRFTNLTHLPPLPQPTVNDPASPAALPSTAGLFFQQFFTVRDAAYSYPAAQNYIDVRDIADAPARRRRPEPADEHSDVGAVPRGCCGALGDCQPVQ